MELLLDKVKHKKLVEDIFTMRVKADKLTEGLGNLGFTSIEGELANVLYFSFDILEDITPEEIREDDEFFEDFSEMDKFEEFYRKWFDAEAQR